MNNDMKLGNVLNDVHGNITKTTTKMIKVLSADTLEGIETSVNNWISRRAREYNLDIDSIDIGHYDAQVKIGRDYGLGKKWFATVTFVVSKQDMNSVTNEIR